jgi:hypothetical protein
MTHKAKDAVCSEIRTVQNTQRKANTMLRFLMLNLMVRKETGRL